MVTIHVAGYRAAIACAEGETVLEALRRNGTAPSVGCRRGGCAVCKVTVLQGVVRYTRPVADTVLDDDEQASGVCLTCRAVPETDLVIALGYRDPRRRDPLATLLAAHSARPMDPAT
jgi:CDP-4-dehydro-6-deoxyglucose reductase